MFSTRKVENPFRIIEQAGRPSILKNVKFLIKQDYDELMPSCGPSKVNICKYCKAEFFIKNKLRLHSKIHILNKALKCSFSGCMKTFKTNKGLNLHLKRHPGYAYYKCKFCEDSYTLSSNCVITTGKSTFKGKGDRFLDVKTAI